MDLEVLDRIFDGREKPTNLSLELLKNITENFSDDLEIGHGGFATVYKGVLPNGNVAVKRIRNSHSINETLFYREVDSLLNIEHKNVVQFLGFCASTDQIAIQIEGSKQHIYAEVRERLLCFEYISNGSLQKYITDELRGLEWNTRYGIIRGICEGLYHLHKEKQIYHMDLKPDNILLDNDMMPKITDFGLSRLDEKTKTMSECRPGSFGYCAPEYLHQGKMSFKSDMYSLGVIIIELVTGQKAIPNNNNNVLRRWRHRWKKTGNETPLVYQQVAKCLEIGLLCQEIDPSKRPYIWHLIHVIREIEGANEKISHAYEHTFGQISPYSEDDMLGIEPLQLHFLFELNKQMSCTLQLTNGTDSYIAFNIENTSPLSYFTQPEKGIMPPQSMCSVEITMQLQGKAPRYMHRANELIVWSTKVNDCLVVEDITTNMFINEAVNVVDDVNLDVVFDVSEPQEASEETSVDSLGDISQPGNIYNPNPQQATPLRNDTSSSYNMDANRNNFPQYAQDPNDRHAEQIYNGSTFNQDIVATTHSNYFEENPGPREARLDDDSQFYRNDNQEYSADGDPLPGIEGFQIVGDPRTGSTLRACGFATNGTTLCNFQWVRCHEDGTRYSIEGATMYDYVVTADDVGTLLAVDCTPMDDSGRQGDLVREFANNENKITCDQEMQNDINIRISRGRADFYVFVLDRSMTTRGGVNESFKVFSEISKLSEPSSGTNDNTIHSERIQTTEWKLLPCIEPGYSPEEWEHATLVLRRTGYQINFSHKDEVVIDEKYSSNLQTKIPNGRTTQFVLVSSGGVNLPFNTQGITEPNSEDNDVRLRDLIVLVMRTFQNKALDAKRKGKA